MADDGKHNVNVVAIGHHETGKSTTIGHLLLNCGELSQYIITRTEEAATRMGAPHLKHAFVMDRTEAERVGGRTIDIFYRNLVTSKYNFTFLDAPGHQDFMKNAIAGISHADVALLVVSAVDVEFEIGLEWRYGGTREHSLLAYTFGVKVICCVNKMDLVGHSEARFNEIQTKVTRYLKKVGFKGEIPFIPISGLSGDNLSEKSPAMDWWKGRTLLEELNAIAPPKRPSMNKPLRISIQDAHRIPGIGTVVTGRICSGVLKPGMELKFAPQMLSDPVRSIEMHHRQVSEARPGDYVGFHVAQINHRDLRRGCVAGDSKGFDPPSSVESFVAQIVVVGSRQRITTSYTPVIDCGTAHVPCKFSEISRLDSNENPNSALKEGDHAIVRLTPLRSLCVERYADYPPLGRICVRDKNEVVCVGVIKDVFRKWGMEKGTLTKAAVKRKK